MTWYDAYHLFIWFKMLTAKQVVKRVEKINNKIKAAQTELNVLQDSICPHHHLTYEPRSCGTWNDDEDYWYEWRCYDCGKQWQTDQTLEATNNYPHAVKIYRYGGMDRADYVKLYQAKMQGKSLV